MEQPSQRTASTNAGEVCYVPFPCLQLLQSFFDRIYNTRSSWMKWENRLPVLQLRSSELSPQSLSPSQMKLAGIQWPVLGHLNWSSVQAELTEHTNRPPYTNSYSSPAKFQITLFWSLYKVFSAVLIVFEGWCSRIPMMPPWHPV